MAFENEGILETITFCSFIVTTWLVMKISHLKDAEIITERFKLIVKVIVCVKRLNEYLLKVFLQIFSALR